MRVKLSIGFGMLVLATLLIACGCGKTSPSKPASTGAKSNSAAQSSQQDGSLKIEASLAKFSAEDRALAVQQDVCPVSGEKLGAMGPPVKMDVNGQTVFLCCDGCKEDLLAKPDEYLAKLKK